MTAFKSDLLRLLDERGYIHTGLGDAGDRLYAEARE